MPDISPPVATTKREPSDVRYRLGFDIGGTFTDFVLLDTTTGALRLHKCLTTPHDPADGALEGIAAITQAAGIALADVAELLHGTTLVTNAIIERRGAKLGFLTTRGVRDNLEMGTEQRYDIYDLFLQYPTPLAPRRLRREIDERIAFDGRVLTALDAEQVRREAAFLVAEGCTAIAVCFLHSYVNPAHEQEAGCIIRAAFPQVAVSLSSEVVPEIREFERATTTCANAYVQPLMDRYVARLESELAARGFRGALRLMQSDGGLATPALARAFPIRLLESGPAGGGLATALFARNAGLPDAIAFDMGGTTAKSALIEGERPEISPMMEAARVHRFKKGSGLPIKSPVIDMIEIGAGGGSIARLDEVGLLKVGPESSGAMPGPVCYGRGGTEPTVTDANLALGYYDPGFFLGGSMSLDRAAAEAALGRLGAGLGLSAVATAAGIHSIVCENMAAAARVHLVEKGRDPRRYAMVAFGGAGPAHAVRVARIMGLSEVLVPPASGAASALGFLAAPTAFEHSRSLPTVMNATADFNAVNAVLDDLEADARRRLAEAGIAPAAIAVERTAEMRLLGQVHQIAVPLPAGALSAARLAEIRTSFADVYTRLYTKLYEGASIEAISWRVRAVGPEPKIAVSGAISGTEAADGTARKGVRPAYFDGAFHETPVYDRYRLKPGDMIDGPAIVEEREATTVIWPDDSLGIDASLNLRIRIGAARAPEALVAPGMSVAEARARIEADPIGLEIMWARLVTITEEMWHTICRTAFSLIISEAQDFGCELLDVKGDPLAHSPRAMQVFNLTLTRCVKALLETFPAHTLKPGDVLATNDPWLCAGHLHDIAIVTPVFMGGRVVGLVGTVGHVSDIGGTKDHLRAREVYEEGIQIPRMMLFREGRANEDLFAMIESNVRNPKQVIGDIHSMVTANAVGAQRLVSFMEEYGLADLEALAGVVQDRAESAMRAAIRAVPDGDYDSEIANNPLGEKLVYKVRVKKRGDSIHVAFHDLPKQLPRGGLNCTMNYTAAHATYPLKSALTPGLRSNAGCYRPFTVEAPEGSILNATKPASVYLRTRVGWYIAPNMFRALAPAIPGQVQAFTGLPVSLNFYGHDARGRLFSDHLFMGGGQGAGQRTDGKSALLYPTSAANTPVELFEARVPVLVIDKSYVTDTGGPGLRRGGLGQRLRARRLDPSPEPMLVSVYPEGLAVRTEGLYGGRPGGAVHGWVWAPGATEPHDCRSGELVQVADQETVVDVQIAGGSGFGDPLDRSIEDVQSDLDDGYISAEAATREYGCVVAADGRIDVAATTKERARRRTAAREAQPA
ncbi:MAG: hydantoinase B/oxoprolinase family protein [Alphaproteobacteria bacterium]|nr:hydantoinase B/oxoprolinase family protein [Alphaproteobacteria bacterium]